MNQSLKLVILILFAFSCTGVGNNKTNQVTHSKKKLLDLHASGLSSALPWPPSFYDYGRSNMLIYNQFSHSIDTIFLREGTMEFKKGTLLEASGPEEVSDFYTFFDTDSLRVFLAGNFLIKKGKDNTYSKENLVYHEAFEHLGPLGFGRITGALFNKIHYSFDGKKNQLFLFAQNLNDKNIYLIQLDLDSNKVTFLDNPVRKELIQKHRLIHHDDGTYISSDGLPFIHFENESIIISFNFQSDLIVFEPSTKKLKSISVAAASYPRSKKPLSINQGQPSIPEVISQIQALSMDVEYSVLQKFGTRGFCRIVRSPMTPDSSKNPKLHLEVFDANLDKVAEIDLTSTFKSIRPNFISTPEGMYLISSNQENEDILEYYFLPSRELVADYLVDDLF